MRKLAKKGKIMSKFELVAVGRRKSAKTMQSHKLIFLSAASTATAATAATAAASAAASSAATLFTFADRRRDSVSSSGDR